MEIVNSCEANNGGCSHTCHHTSSGPACTCNFGYRLEGDQKTCTGKARENLHPLSQTHLESWWGSLYISCVYMHYKQVNRAGNRCKLKGDEKLFFLKTSSNLHSRPPWTAHVDFRTSLFFPAETALRQHWQVQRHIELAHFKRKSRILAQHLTQISKNLPELVRSILASPVTTAKLDVY